MLANMGWWLVILLLPELIYRVMFIILSLFNIFKHKPSRWYYTSLGCYLLSSLCYYDGSDGGMYALAGLWQHPPSAIGALIMWLHFIWLFLSLVLLVIGLCVSKSKHP